MKYFAMLRCQRIVYFQTVRNILATQVQVDCLLIAGQFVDKTRHYCTEY